MPPTDSNKRVITPRAQFAVDLIDAFADYLKACVTNRYQRKGDKTFAVIAIVCGALINSCSSDHDNIVYRSVAEVLSAATQPSQKGG